jgi:hypothetical protein
VTVECDAGVAGHLLDALEDLAGQDLADVALAELRTLRVVVLVQLKLEILFVLFRNENSDRHLLSEY